MQYNLSFSGEYDGLSAYVFIFLLGLVVCFLLGLVCLPALVVAALARRQAEKVYNLRVGTVLTQYAPPRDLSPAEIGLLYDMKCDAREIMATVFHLEQRGIVGISSKTTVDITDQTAFAQLAEYEQLAVHICNGTKTGRTIPIYLPGATAHAFQLTLPTRRTRRDFTAAVQRSLEAKGVALRNYTATFWRRVALTALLISLLPMLQVAWSGSSNGVSYEAWSGQAFAAAGALTAFFGILFLPAYLVAAMSAIGLWTKIAGRYWLNTKQARQLWPELEGYRLYLAQVDLDNIQFESLETVQNPATMTLPYALALGLDTKWQQRLANRASA